MEYARVTMRFGCLKRRESISRLTILVADIPQGGCVTDQPLAARPVLPSFHCAREARGDGVDRILAGVAVMSFSQAIHATPRNRFDHWQRLRPARCAMAFWARCSGLPIGPKLPVARKSASYVAKRLNPCLAAFQEYNLIANRLPADLSAAVPGPVSQGEIESAQNAVWAQAEAPDELDRHRPATGATPCPNAICPRWVAHSVGWRLGRLPNAGRGAGAVLDATASGLQGQGPGIALVLQRRHANFLPDEVITKKKQGFGLPFGVWMVEHAALNALTRDAVVVRSFLEA